MAILTVAQGISFARTLAMDTNSTVQALADADYTSLFNEAYVKWYQDIEPRIAYLTPTQFGGNALAAAAYNFTPPDKNIIEVLDVFLGANASATFGTLLERDELNNVLGELAGSPANDTPARWAVDRPTQTTSTNIGKWQVFFTPPCAGATGKQDLGAIVRYYPAALATTDTPDVSEASAYTLFRIVAARAARIIGRDDQFIADIMGPVPQDVQSAFGMAARAAMGPRERQGEKPA